MTNLASVSQRLGKPGEMARRLASRHQREYRPRAWAAAWRCAKIFANPLIPGIDDDDELFTYDYQHLHNAPEGKNLPTARPRSRR
ncbi:hypothetical protein ACNKHQ_10170 [Shigella flexneri]